MNAIKQSMCLLVFLAMLSTVDARADIYKCTDADGAITYTQIPCRNQKSVTVNSAGISTEVSDVDCTFASGFARLTANLMRGGARSDEVFARFGGLESLSNGSINTINYVYGFRSNDGISVERITTLTRAKCRAKSLGDVSCDAFPTLFTDELGGCGADPESDQASSECKDKYRDAIDEIDAQMRRDYTPEQGDNYRERLRGLTEQMRQC